MVIFTSLATQHISYNESDDDNMISGTSIEEQSTNLLEQTHIGAIKVPSPGQSRDIQS